MNLHPLVGPYFLALAERYHEAAAGSLAHFSSAHAGFRDWPERRKMFWLQDVVFKFCTFLVPSVLAKSSDTADMLLRSDLRRVKHRGELPDLLLRNDSRLAQQLRMSLFGCDPDPHGARDEAVIAVTAHWVASGALEPIVLRARELLPASPALGHDEIRNRPEAEAEVQRRRDQWLAFIVSFALDLCSEAASPRPLDLPTIPMPEWARRFSAPPSNVLDRRADVT